MAVKFDPILGKLREKDSDTPEEDVESFIAAASDETTALTAGTDGGAAATNIFAHAGKCKVPCIVLACDTQPEHDTKAPSKMVKVYPRKIDLENTKKLKSFESTTVVSSVDDLKKVLSKI